MRQVNVLILLLVLVLWPVPNPCQADVDIGVSIDKDGLKGFYLAIGEHYKVPEKEIIVVRQKNIPDEELPVVFFLASRAGVAPSVIIKLRLGGKSWMAITAHFGLNAGIFYVPAAKVSGPPYGKAYGHFKNKKKAKWGAIRLSDAEVVNFVNLKFISEHYGRPADDIIKMRQKGANFVSINAEVKKSKGRTRKAAEKVVVNTEPAEKSKAKGKSKKK
jgi:hypothetical protein